MNITDRLAVANAVTKALRPDLYQKPGATSEEVVQVLGLRQIVCDALPVGENAPPDDLKQHMETQQLKGAVSAARHSVSRAIQILHLVKVCVEEDDPDEAMELLNGATEGSSLEPLFSVSVQRMVESHRTTYWVTLLRSDRPKNATAFDSEGRITPSYHVNLEHANHEGQEWANFLGVEFTPYVESPRG